MSFALIWSTGISAEPGLAMSPIVYWVWPQSQDLRQLDPQKEAIAPLIATIALTSTGISMTMPRAICRTPHAISKIAVIHLTIANRLHPQLSILNAKRICLQIQKIYQTDKYVGIQIDFSATHKQKEFYALFLKELRATLGDKVNISITALASWCVGEAWIHQARLPINYVVPMYFSLALSPQEKARFIRDFPKKFSQLASECQQAIGLSTSESWRFPLQAKVPVFIYHPHAWQQPDIAFAKNLALAVQK